jgi:polyisoprenoid-binding protein YceI
MKVLKTINSKLTMKHILILLLAILSLYTKSYAQKYFTRTAYLNFQSTTPLEDINATSQQATAVFDAETGEMAWAVLMKSFQFKKALMQEHFNENYIDSDKFPKATFKGKIANYSQAKLKDNLEVEVEGEMNLHGVTKPFKSKGLIKMQNGDIILTSAFTMRPEDYNISIPQLVREKIAKVMDVKVEAKCSPKK